jgi:Mrp family chromosome partitioning ATPase
MARMLQALKNLEARSTPRPAPAAPLPASAPPAENSAPPASGEPTAQVPSDPAREVTSHIDFAASALAGLSVSTSNPFWPAPEFATPTYDITLPGGAVEADLVPSTSIPEPSPAPPKPLVLSAPTEAPRASHRPPAIPTPGHRSTTFEKTALRVLTDPIRARPLVELAERLDADSKQTGSRTMLLAGVGSADDVHQTLLYTGILMTERQPGDVLLVDADWSSRVFSSALERDRQRGFGELIDESASIAEVCYPTATSRLFFLPAGQQRLTDLSTAGSRLEAALKKLAGRFALVLIDGGHCGDLASSALARQTDATYLVIRLGAVEAATAQTALRDFRASGARVLGCIAT